MLKILINKLCLLFLIGIYSQFSWAQPANDLPCSATNVGTLTLGTSVVLTNQTNVNATTTTAFSTIANTGNFYNADYHLSDVWYKFVLPTGYKSAKITLTTSSNKRFTLIQRDKYTCTDYDNIQNSIAPVGSDYISTEVFATSANQTLTSVRTYGDCQYASFANGDTVYVSVGGVSAGQQGIFNLSFEVYGILGGGCPPATYTCGTVGFNWQTGSAPSSANLSCTNNTNYGLKANTISTAGNYIAPGFTIGDGSGAITYSAIEIEEGLGTGFVNIPGQQKVITYCVPSFQYRIRLTGSGSGSVTITDHSTGTTLYSGTFSSGMIITLAPNTILGTSTFSGPGVSNYKLGSSTLVGSGYGVFNPSIAGVGTHTIVYSWNNGNGCSGSNTITVTVSCPTPLCGTVDFNWQTGSAPSTANLNCSNNTNYGLKANTIAVAGNYIAPGFTIGDGSGTITYSAIEIEEGLGTGFVNIPGQQKVITYCVPSFQYRIRLTGSGSGSVNITDHATGTTIYSGVFSSGMIITLAPNTILGSSIFSGPGVSNYKLGSSSTIGSGYGVFNPSLAGTGTHNIIYTWDNGNGCSGSNTITVTVSGPSNPTAANAQICSGSTAALTASGGSSYNWYDAATAGNLVGSQATFTTPTLTVPTSYWVSSGSGSCMSARVKVDVTITNPITPTFSSISSLCIGSTAPSLPSSSNNSIPGTWNPANISTSTVGTTNYLFTPSTGQCATTAQVSVVVLDKTLPIFTAISPLCQNDAVPTLSLTSTNGISGVWTPTQISTNTVGNVTYNFVANSGQCAADTSMMISVVAPIQINVSTDAQDGNPTVVANFVNSTTNATSFDWDFGNGSTSNSAGNVSSSYSSIGTYTIILTASNGVCPDQTWTKTINVTPYLPIIYNIPNIFSPNGDGANDDYFISVENGAAFEAIIINRWGEEMIALSQLNEKWNGKTKSGDSATDGVYFILYKITGLDGKVIEGQAFFHLTNLK